MAIHIKLCLIHIQRSILRPWVWSIPIWYRLWHAGMDHSLHTEYMLLWTSKWQWHLLCTWTELNWFWNK